MSKNIMEISKEELKALEDISVIHKQICTVLRQNGLLVVKGAMA